MLYLGRKDVPFVSEEGWMKNILNDILNGFSDFDCHLRVAPLVLVRCFRGGKSRALSEIAEQLRMKDIPVLSISFNDYSKLEDWEHDDPVGAVCRRIAFVASLEPDTSYTDLPKRYEEYKDVEVSQKEIEEFLGNNPCILMIDEMKKELMAKDENELTLKSIEFGAFLRKNFVIRTRRYLIFTSRLFTTKNEVSNFLEPGPSYRGVFLRNLPKVPSLAAAKTLDPGITAIKLLYYGKIPGLVYQSYLGSLPLSKRDDAIENCVAKKDGVTTKAIKNLVSSFFTGDWEQVPEPLLELMTTKENTDKSKDDLVQWIPFHMVEVLKDFKNANSKLKKKEDKLSDFETNVLNWAAKHLNVLEESQIGSGVAWERLFVAVLLMRCFVGRFDGTILPELELKNPSVSYNDYFESDFSLTKEPIEFLAAINEPGNYPHVAVYYPKNAGFKLYDAFVAFWPSKGKRETYGYQLKEGKALPDEAALSREQVEKILDDKSLVDKVFVDKSFVIRGEPAQKQGETNGWITLSESEINNFFGPSGEEWTPKKWKELMKEEKALKKIKRSQ